MFVIVFISTIVGLLDAIGITLFFPLFQYSGVSQGTSSFQIKGFDPFEVFGISHVENKLVYVLVIIIIVFFIKAILKYLEGYLRVVFQQFFIRSLRIELAEMLTNYSYASFIKMNSGEIQNNFTVEVSRISIAFNNFFNTIQSISIALVYIFLSIITSPFFVLIIFGGGLIITFIYKYFNAFTKRLSMELTTQNQELQNVLIQNVQSFKYLKATGLISNYVLKIKIFINDIEKSQRSISIVSTFLQSIREPFIIIFITGLIYSYVVLGGGSMSSLLISLILFYRAFSYLVGYQISWNKFLGFSGSISKIENFKLELKENQEIYGELTDFKFEKNIQFVNASYSYGEKTVLNNVSLNVEKNEMVAIVGSSGSGKTTLINLMTGLLKPHDGDIFLDEINYNILDSRRLQKNIGYITQDPIIFNDSIYNNITFWDEQNDQNLNRFNEALRKAEIFDFVYELDEKFQTKLGSNGVNLSGGQKQRISIARELYKNVEILILDEATSSLDSETEFEIHKNITSLKGHYTIILIAHRLSTIKNADKIVLLEKGEIVQVESYENLMQTSEKFHRMVKLQGL